MIDDLQASIELVQLVLALEKVLLKLKLPCGNIHLALIDCGLGIQNQHSRVSGDVVSSGNLSPAFLHGSALF